MSAVIVDDKQVEVFARFLAETSGAEAFDFCSLSEGFIYPERGKPRLLDCFFFSCGHQFGFWTLRENRWEAPMIAALDGKKLKGSDFLFRAVTRAWQRQADIFEPVVLTGMSDGELDAIFHSDGGTNPLPMWAEHLELIRGYADWFVRRGLTPAEVVREAAGAEKPLAALLAVCREIPGYAEDPMQKKAMLLAITLENRPEKFLPVRDPESAVPIIDYHLQRSALRTGLVRVEDADLRRKLVGRELLVEAEEGAVREATYQAIARLMARSGLSAAAVDWFFFQNRTRCPEMTEPDCPACPVEGICARETKLFQPVWRTTAY
jgi:hypothetical protein